MDTDNGYTRPDVRWKQRFNNYLKALQTLTEAVDLASRRELTALEEQGVIQGFEFTHELAWKMLKDYFEEQGIPDLIGSKNVTRTAFRNGLIDDGEAWMSMVAIRNRTSHTYDPEFAHAAARTVLKRFYPAFTALADTFTRLGGEEDV